MAQRNWPDGWWIEIYDETESSLIGLQSGPDRDENECWGEWNRRAESYERIPLPDPQQDLFKVFVQLNNPERRQVEAAVLFNGQVKQRYSFDGSDEWHEIRRDD